MTIGDSTFTGKVQRAVQESTSKLSKSFSKLSSGLRVERGSDDPAGLAVAVKLGTEADVRAVASRNARDAQLVGEFAASALGTISEITGRMSELAAQASNGTLSNEQRAALDDEYQSLRQEIDRIASTTEFNGIKPLTGQGITAQVGADGGATSTISSDVSVNIPSINPSGDIRSEANAKSAIDSIANLRHVVNEAAGALGALNARLELSAASNDVAVENLRASESRIRDVDVAAEVAEKVSSEIQQRSGVALLAQGGNINAETVLRLLR